jgi:Tol biopolymer transport system component
MLVMYTQRHVLFPLLRAAAFGCAALSLLMILFINIGGVNPTEQIAFSGGIDNDRVFLVDVRQSVALPIFRHGLNYGTGIAWSPDGGKAAFIARSVGAGDVFLLDLASGETQNLTSTDAREDAPTWLDDHRIAFWSWRDEGFRRVYTVDIRTGENTPLLDPMIPNADARYAWSPDASRYALVTWRHGQAEIYVRRLTDNESVRLTDHPAFDYNPAWSPDGTQLAFWTTRDNDQMRLYVMNADGSDPHPITPILPSTSDLNWSVAWSSDGASLAFNADHEGRPAIYAVPALGGVPHRILFIDAEFQPALAWRPQ